MGHFQSLVDSGRIRGKASIRASASDALANLIASKVMLRIQDRLLLPLQPASPQSAFVVGTAMIQDDQATGPPSDTSQPLTPAPPYAQEELSLTEPLLGSSLEERALAAMRKLLGKHNASWKSEGQRQAVLAVLECKRDVLAVLKTGEGKTMLFLLPALLEEGRVTVVVVPLISLMTDYERKLTRDRIPFEVFRDGRTHLSVRNTQQRWEPGKV